MLSRHLLAFALAATLLVSARVAGAQDAAARIGVCNWVKVLDAMDEWNAVKDKLKNDQQKYTLERGRRKLELEDMMRQRNELKPESAQFREKAKLVAEKEIEHVVWEQMTQLSITRSEKEAIQQMYGKIVDAVREVAESRKLDLVLAEKKPEIPQNADRLTAADIAGILSQRDVLYSNDKVDITQAVILLVNKKYAAGASSSAAGGEAPKAK